MYFHSVVIYYDLTTVGACFLPIFSFLASTGHDWGVPNVAPLAFAIFLPSEVIYEYHVRFISNSSWLFCCPLVFSWLEDEDSLSTWDVLPVALAIFLASVVIYHI